MTNQYDTIRASMDATIQSIRTLNRDHVAERHRLGYELAEYLRECKTMGFYIPRQCGAMLWSAQQLVAGPDNYLFVHPGIERLFLTNYDRSSPFVCSSDLPTSVPMTKAQFKRIRSWPVLGGYIKEDRALPTSPKLVLIHDAGVFFDKVRITKFYEWLANHPGVDEATEVILVN